MGSGGGGGKKGGGSGEYFRYHLSLQMGIAQQLDEITSIILGDRAIWTGSITQSTVFNVADENLFGGGKREGGVNGAITVMMGEDHQQLPPYLEAKYGSSLDGLIPSYRNMTTLFFHEPVSSQYNGAFLADLYSVAAGSVLTGRAGFYFQANNPYLRTLNVIGSRMAKGLSRKYATIWRDDAETIPDTNPAHIIYELQVNRDFGAGLPITRINVESFELAAKTLYDEDFGISIKWVNQGKVRDMILEVLDHINALLYEDPRTGLLTLKLLRGDYVVDDLETADHSNCVVTGFQRKQEELVNEVVVTYTNSETYEEASVTVQDLAGIAAEGGVISTGRNYYGVHKSSLAKKLGERDIRAEGYPLATADVQFFREFWDLKPGMVLKLDSPEDSDDILIMRVMKIEDDTTATAPLKAQLVEDIFSLAAAPIFSTPDTLFEDPDLPAQEADNIQAMTMPYTFAVRAGLKTPEEDDYPAAHLGVLAASDQAGVDFFEIAGDIVGALGSSRFDVLSTNTIIPRGTLTNAVTAEANSVIDHLTGLTNGTAPAVETILVVGTGDDEDLEFMGIYETTDTTYSVRRGILDTVPRDWPAGTPVWALSLDSTFFDSTERAAFENVEFKVLPISQTGTLSVNDATLQDFDLTERPHLPFRPADVQVEGVGFGTYVSTDRESKDVTWANRLRTGEDAVILPWDDPSVTPETNQTTEIDILRQSDRQVIATHTGIAGTSFTIPKASWGSEDMLIVKVYAERDGYRSLQAHEIIVQLPEAVGYGNNYGRDYGA